MNDREMDGAMENNGQPGSPLDLAVLSAFSSGIVSFGGNAACGLPEKPFSNQILLLDDAYVAGTTHVEGIEEMLEGVKPGDRVDFLRDPDNYYDEWAIKVILPGKGRIGFLPDDLNQIIARLMDGGKCVFGQITDIEKLGRWMRVSMEVYLDD